METLGVAFGMRDKMSEQGKLVERGKRTGKRQRPAEGPAVWLDSLVLMWVPLGTNSSLAELLEWL